MMDIYVTDERMYGTPYTLYHVFVDGKLYDSMTLLKPPRLTWSQMSDMADGYREALENYERS